MPADGMELTIPVGKNWARHDLYLNVQVVRPGDKSQATIPKRAVGLLHLPMADEARRLNIALAAPEKMRPNQPLTVKIKAQVTEGKIPAQINVLLSAVDSGVLNITDYATPDPWNGFFGRKRYGADIYDVYGQVIEGSGQLAALRFGGDGDEDEMNRGGKPPVNHVNIIVQQAQPVVLDANGEGSVTLPIGDFNGELRLMAQAWTDSDFGSAERKIIVAAPLVAELNRPRFMASGDAAKLVLDLTNLTAQPQTLNIGLSASGTVAMKGQAARAVTLQPGARTTLAIPVEALGGYGDGEVAAHITGLKIPGEKLEPETKTWKIGVRPAFPAQSEHDGLLLRPGEVWQAPARHIDGFLPATLEGQLVLSGQPPFSLARYVRELRAYPYGCLEQTTSGLFPSLYTNAAQLKALGITGESDEQRHRAVELGISRLLEMQRANGSFALWNRDGSEEYWLTAYVTDFLVRAGEQGYSVPVQALNSANARLLRYLQDANQITPEYTENRVGARFATAAYVGLVLARQQKAPLGALRELWSNHNNAASGLPLVQLGVALKLMGDAPRSRAALDAGLKTPRVSNQWLSDYGSELRDTALILSLLNEYNLLPAERTTLLLQLSELAFGQRWLSTQENNSLYLAARNLDTQNTRWQAQTTLPTSQLAGSASTTYPLAAQELNALKITNTGDTPLWVRLDSSGYPQQAPKPVSNVLSIVRTYVDMDGKQRKLTTLKSGELVLVKLAVRASRTVPDALVVDLLPAGLELENQNLAASSASLSDSADGIQNLVEQMKQQAIKHIEFRDDRFVAALSVNSFQRATLVYLARAVTPGEYIVPPPQVESMYVPEWRASGQAELPLTVEP